MRRLLEWQFWMTLQRGNREKKNDLLIHLFSTEKLPSWSLELGLFTVKVDCRYEPDLIELQRIWILIQEVLITVDELRKRAGNFKASNFNNYKLRNAVRKILLLDDWFILFHSNVLLIVKVRGGGRLLLYSSPPLPQPILLMWNNSSFNEVSYNCCWRECSAAAEV